MIFMVHLILKPPEGYLLRANYHQLFDAGATIVTDRKTVDEQLNDSLLDLHHIYLDDLIYTGQYGFNPRHVEPPGRQTPS